MKVPSNKTTALTKSMNKDIWVAVTSNQLLIRGSNTKTKFSEKKMVTDKTSFFVNCLILTSEMAVYYRNIVFKKWCSNFLKKAFIFEKICFKVKVLKITFQL